jgi:endoglucanase
MGGPVLLTSYVVPATRKLFDTARFWKTFANVDARSSAGASHAMRMRKSTFGAAIITACAATLAFAAPADASARSLMLGAWLPNGLDATQIAPFQQLTGRRLDIVAVSMPWVGANGYLLFNVALPWVNAAYQNGTVPLISWEPMMAATAQDPYSQPLPGACPAQIATAPSDSAIIQYITSYAQQVAAFRLPVLIRLMHEANYAPSGGGWYWGLGDNPWCGTVTNANFIAAWQRIVKIFQSEGATNAQFVWCINWANFGVSSYTAFYPGDAYVSYTAIDGYNWGGQAWYSFDQIFSNAYNQIELVTNRPVLIGEWASAEYNADDVDAKASWIKQSFATVEGKNYPNIVGLLWFEQNQSGQPPWPITSSASAAAAYGLAVRGVPLPW